MLGELVERRKRGPYRRKVSDRTQLALEALCDGAADTVAQAATIAGITSRALHMALKKDHVRAWLRERIGSMFGAGQAVAARRMFALLKSDNSMSAYRASAFILGVAGVQPVQEKQPLVNINMGVQAGYVIDLSGGRSDGPSPPPKAAGPVLDLKANAVDEERWPTVP